MTYVYQEYPKWLAEGVIVKNAEEEKAYRTAQQQASALAIATAAGPAQAGAAIAAAVVAAPALEEMSKAELQQFADEQGIKVNKYATKTELIAEIRAAMQKAKA